MHNEVSGKHDIINNSTFLSSDYLNYYNEVVMILELLGEEPTLLELLVNWKPKEYKQYFRESALGERELIIKLYDRVPVVCKLALERVVLEIDNIIISLLANILYVYGSKITPDINKEIFISCQNVKELLFFASRIIQGEEISLSSLNKFSSLSRMIDGIQDMRLSCRG